MNKYEFWYDLKSNENPTITEKLLLKYRNILTNISERCIDESKCHMESIVAIEKIREELNKLNSDYKLFD